MGCSMDHALTTSRAAYTLRAHRTSITGLDFSFNGLDLCSSDDSGWTVWWNLETRRPLAIWKSHENSVISTKFAAHNSELLLFTHGRDNKLRVWRLESAPDFNITPISLQSNAADYKKPWLVHTQDINSLNFCSISITEVQSRLLFACTSTLSSEKIDIYLLEPFSRPIKGLAPDVVQSDQDFDDPDKQERSKLGIVMAVLLLPTHLIAGYESGEVAIWKRTGDQQVELCFLEKLHKDALQMLYCHKNFVYTTASDRSLCRINLSSFDHISAKLPHKGVYSITQVNEILYTSGWDGFIRQWTPDLKEITAEKGREAGLSALASTKVTWKPVKRRIRPLPAAWLAIGGKDARISLYGLN